MRPQSIIIFERLVYGVIGIGLMSLVLSFDMLNAAAALGGPSVGLLILIPLAIFGLYALLVYFVARKASTTAKWIYTIIAALSVGFGIMGLGQMGALPPHLMLLNLISYGATGASLFFLFRPDATAWFQEQTSAPSSAYPGQPAYPPQPAQPPLGQDHGWPPQPAPAPGWPSQPTPAPTAWPPAPAPQAPVAQAPQAAAGWPPTPPPAAAAQGTPAWPPAPPAAPEPPAAAAQPAPTAPAAQAAPQYRPCPYCAEEIRAQAIKCRYCGSDVEPLPA